MSDVQKEKAGGQTADLTVRHALTIMKFAGLLREAARRLDLAYQLTDEEAASAKFAETRDKIREALNDV